MSQATATLVGAAILVIVNLLTAAFVYGQLTQRVKSHGRRLENLEEVVSGRGGHGERITRLEAARLSKAQHGSGD